ncbi:DUF3422 domain-containing protein [Vreelandella venusta]|uniref:DUF3422 domain-containing protein n=1 Tax=Vreelandella venusta TaxID=44935 RepID=UPI00228662DE|nr:DUF3422 domain-containing protein [Halomonas venusta]WAM54849.1 DUF3422 domain-containing protein [Halomonas venusta]
MHAQHTALHNELHARPPIYFEGPACLHHYAFTLEGDDVTTLLNHLAELTEVAVTPDQVQQIVSCQGCLVKWERHTEFFTLTIKHDNNSNPRIWPTPPTFLARLLADVADKIISASVLRVETANRWAGSVEAYGLDQPAGSQVGGGDATVWSDFNLDDQQRNRLLMVNDNLDSYRLGRMARRLFDIETYRIMAMLALPEAKALSRELQHYETELSALSHQHAEQHTSPAEPLLNALTLLSAKLERCGVQTRQRFSATDAYASIVLARINELREERIGNYPRLGMFILRRFEPAVRYCDAMNRRVETLATSATRLNDLLRTRTQVEIERQNYKILQSLDARASSQLKIQKAVEGLSIIVISYYIFSLMKLGLESLRALGVDIEPNLAASVIAPLSTLIIAILTWRIWKVKKH